MTSDHQALEIGKRLTGGVLAPMKELFVGKDEIIDLMGVCLAGGENLFILGPPGTAKSALVHELGRRIHGQTFEYLLTRFTEPNELFGPFDIRKLREGILETNSEGMLPEASLVFLDELLNANSAILNSILTVLNERVLRRGREVRRLPLLMVVGASNQLPEEEALRALFDRFLMRAVSLNVPDDDLERVLAAGWRLDQRAAPDCPVSADDIRRLNALLHTVELAPAAEAFAGLVRRLRQAGIAVSDRRAVKLQRLVAASALLCQRLSAHATDLWVMRHIWDVEEQREILRHIVDEAIEEHSAAAESGSVEAHPQATGAALPDPERLARDLDTLAAAIEQTGSGGGEDEAARLAHRDQLAAIGSRIQWIENPEQRRFLEGKLAALWEKAEPPSA